MTIADLAPAIGGIVLGGGLWIYTHYLRRKLREARRADPSPHA